MFKFKDMPYDETTQYSNFIAHEFDNCLENLLGIDKEKLGDILPSDRIFYDKVTSHILPDETDIEDASRKILEVGLLSKADKAYEPTPEQTEIMERFTKYMHSDDHEDDLQTNGKQSSSTFANWERFVNSEIERLGKKH